MRRAVDIVVAVALLALPAGVHPASAASQTTCRFSFDETVSPGLGVRGSSGTFTSGGESGPLVCSGPVNGAQPSGRGTIGTSGRYGVAHADSCVSGVTGDGEGDGVDRLTIPTTSGTQTVRSPFTFTFGGKAPSHGGLVAGEFRGDHLSGTFEFTPIEGDCVSRPVTRVHVTGEGVLH